MYQDNSWKSEKFKCDHCPKSFGLKENMTIHKYKFFQTWCILIFDKWNLETKELYAWKEEGAFLSCYQCGTRFALNTNLKNHSKNEKLRGNQCKSCEKSFPSGRYLGNPHISIVHLVDDGLRLLKCIHFI